jgi:hypothetical protein
VAVEAGEAAMTDKIIAFPDDEVNATRRRFLSGGAATAAAPIVRVTRFASRRGAAGYEGLSSLLAIISRANRSYCRAMSSKPARASLLVSVFAHSLN